MEVEVIEALVALYDAAESAYDRGSVRPLRPALEAVDEAMFRAYGRARKMTEQSKWMTLATCTEGEIQAIRRAAGGHVPTPEAAWLLRNGGLNGSAT